MASPASSSSCTATCFAPHPASTCLSHRISVAGGESVSEPTPDDPPRIVREIRLVRRESESQRQAEHAGVSVSDPFTMTLIRIKARQLCHRRDFPRCEYDDLRQGMRLYLLEKAHLFNPARGNAQAFVTNMLKTWVAMELRFRNRAKRSSRIKVVSLERTLVPCDGGLAVLHSVLLEADGQRLRQTESPAPAEAAEVRAAVQHAMRNVPPEDKAILIHVAEHGVASAARTFDVSRRQILNALARVRVHFEKAGLGST